MKETETKTKPKKESEQKDSDKPLSNFDKSDKPKSEEPKSVSFPKEFESGGFPSPSQLEEYNSVADGTAARILQMAHTQQTQRHRLQSARLSVRRLQSWLGFFICMGAIASGIAIVISGENLWGIAPIIAALGTLIVIYLYD